LRSHLDTLDFIGIIPDTYWTDRGPFTCPRYIEIEASVDVLNWLVERKRLVAHGLGLSIGTAGFFDIGHVQQMCQWQKRYGFCWYSEHLSFNRIPLKDGRTQATGMALPVCYDKDVLAMIAQRVAYVKARMPVPFLLENNVFYTDIPDQEMTEQEFLNALCIETGCELLLDLHNVYTNAGNHGFDACAFVEKLDLQHVTEVHIAGGSVIDGMYTDSHAGACPDEVWNLLAFVASRAQNLKAVTFEFHESYYSLLGEKRRTS
jgi:uncharacterized protein (UPF0276 family)